MRGVDVQRLQNARGVRDDEERAVRALTEEPHALGHRAHGVHVQTGVGLVEDGELRLEHEHLQNFGFLFLAAGKAHVQVAFGVALVHAQQPHGLPQALFEVPKPQAVAGLLLQRAADEGAERHARHLQRVLEGEEDAAFSALIDRQGGDVLAVKYDAAARHGVDRIAGDGVAERGFSRAVRPHENVRLVAPDREVNAVKDLLFPRADVQAIDL